MRTKYLQILNEHNLNIRFSYFDNKDHGDIIVPKVNTHKIFSINFKLETIYTYEARTCTPITSKLSTKNLISTINELKSN